MKFNFFKRKKVREPKVFEGKFLSDEEFKKMVIPKNETFIKKEFDEINKDLEMLKNYVK